MVNILNAPHIRVRVGRPIGLTYEDAQTDTDRIMAAIMDLLPKEAHRRHDPTPRELAKTFPPGKTPPAA